MLEGKNVVLGVAGSIAAYKSVYLARLLLERGAQVWPVLTRSATRFVGPLTFSALCGRRAVTDLWSEAEAGDIGHVEAGHRADLLLLAPATADLMARVAIGRADDPLAAIALSTSAPKLLAPAMETGMWENEATVGHLASLKDRGYAVVAPGEGALASGRMGAGRMAEPEAIVEHALRLLSPGDLKGHRVLVTAGPTREHVDPARFISNPSTGQMGFAIARALWRRGAEVSLVHGPTPLAPPAEVDCTKVQSTTDMLEACRQHLSSCSALIMAAAPADFRPAEVAQSKQKKEGKEEAAWNLVATPDILRTLGARSQGLVAVGFAAETDDLVTHARAKLLAKDLDLIVANPIGRPGAGFAAKTNQVTLIARDGEPEALPTLSKEAVADEVVSRVVGLLAARS